MYILNEKIFVLLISLPVKGKTVYYICFPWNSESFSSSLELQQSIGLAPLLTNQSARSISVIFYKMQYETLRFRMKRYSYLVSIRKLVNNESLKLTYVFTIFLFEVSIKRIL